jgi:hypothetical protein
MLCTLPVGENVNAFNISTANLIRSITSLLFAVNGQKTAKVRLFLRRLDLQKGRSFRGRIRLADCFFAEK